MKKMRYEQLTFTRFLAALSIVVFHYGTNIFPFNYGAINFLFKQAYISVSYFFLLSGFIMIIAYKNKGEIKFLDFLKKRFARIYPVYGLSILTLITYKILTSQPLNLRDIFLNITIVQSWIPEFALSLNSPGWSLSVEVFFYITFPFLLNKFYSKCTFYKLITPIIVFFIVSQIVLHVLIKYFTSIGFPSYSHNLIFYFPLMHFNEFLIGNLAGLFFIKGIKVRNYDYHIVIIIIFLFLLLLFKLEINFHNGMLSFIFIPFIILISSNNGYITKLFNTKYCVFFGKISFGMYILQVPVFYWVGGFIKYINISNPVIIFYSSLTILILFSSICYVYFETPLRKSINKVKS
jgi:peptidoglycan/LPS O-acetylase OafA/YrhL